MLRGLLQRRECRIVIRRRRLLVSPWKARVSSRVVLLLRCRRLLRLLLWCLVWLLRLLLLRLRSHAGICRGGVLVFHS